jgi:tripartite-type tricarboxylate transporter receptor subunit TctC
MNLIKTIISSLILCVSASASAFDPRTKPVQVIMPFTSGGSTDVSFRHLQKYAAGKNITLVSVYKPGGDGIVSFNELNNLPKDGYYLSVTTAAVIANNRVNNAAVDTLVITGIRDNIMSVVTSTKSNLTSLDALELSIKNGDNISIGYGAPGPKLFIDQLVELTKTKHTPLTVPYKSGGLVVNDVIAGHIDVAVAPYTIVKNHVAAGKINLIAVSSKEKIPGVTAPIIDQRYPAWQHYDGIALVVSSGTNPDSIKWWGDFMREYLSDPQVRSDILNEGATASEFGTRNLEKAIKASISKLQK